MRKKQKKQWVRKQETLWTLLDLNVPLALTQALSSQNLKCHYCKSLPSYRLSMLGTLTDTRWWGNGAVRDEHDADFDGMVTRQATRVGRRRGIAQIHRSRLYLGWEVGELAPRGQGVKNTRTLIPIRDSACRFATITGYKISLLDGSAFVKLRKRNARPASR